jgi:hypothetical protein
VEASENQNSSSVNERKQATMALSPHWGVWGGGGPWVGNVFVDPNGKFDVVGVWPGDVADEISRVGKVLVNVGNVEAVSDVADP